MIERIEAVLEGSGEPGLIELRRTLDDLLGETSATWTFRSEERLKPRVHRLRFAGPQGASSLVVKRLEPGEALRNELVARRWLPAVGLGANGPGLLGVSAARGGGCVWHVYEDLGDGSIQGREADAARVAEAARFVAELHSRFASHPLLAECRRHCGHLDISYFAANVRDAIHSLHAMRRPGATLSASAKSLTDRLLARLTRLHEDEPRRAQALSDWGGPETLLHGDLWTSNTFVLGHPDGYRTRLIDWDRAGVGPASYDLSAFLLRFAPERRRWVLDLYAQSLEGEAWRLPGRAELNLLFETAELARYANRVVWPALAIARDGAAWGLPELAMVDGWFEALGPVLPEESTDARADRGPAGGRERLVGEVP